MNLNLVQEWMSFYKYVQAAVLENQNYHTYGDRTILTDDSFVHHRSGIGVTDKWSQNVKIIDVTVPLDRNIQ